MVKEKVKFENDLSIVTGFDIRTSITILGISNHNLAIEKTSLITPR